ncbi:hypothetical protein TL16_g05963 [Triparma laevis f. inornata]|uniref:Uncharacterized protein n=1 Tax=Triparma laevis f. inornata TaxID=1714386 RepID=A0A9W7EC32_9STRA|nr:hypothetical protein TL16_g05963 [Triparma laevis f. inornata]
MFEKRFLAQAPLNATLDALAFNLPDSYLHPSVQNQIAIMVYSALNSPTPPSARYALKLLQAYSKLVESTNSFVEDDDFMMTLAQTIAACKNLTTGDPDLLCYECYKSPNPSLLPSSAPLAIRIAPFHNDVGLRCWEAGYFLAEFFLHFPDLIKNKRVLEFGEAA